MSPVDELLERLEAAYEAVKLWPENDENGFMKLLTLRNEFPEAAALIRSLQKAQTSLEAENEKLREALKDIIQGYQELQWRDGVAILKPIEDQPSWIRRARSAVGEV